VKLYAGIGSRKTPSHYLHLIETTAEAMREYGWTLRTGHAPGADQHFERGARADAQVYLPWPDYEYHVPVLAAEVMDGPTSAGYNIAARYHPAWERCSRGARALHARNTHIILGRDCDEPVDFVVYFSHGIGGTEQALRVARAYDVPTFNLLVVADLSKLWRSM
jgi:hypothetical protein